MSLIKATVCDTFSVQYRGRGQIWARKGSTGNSSWNLRYYIELK